MSRAEVVKRLKTIEADQVGTARSPLGSNKVKYNTSYYGRVVRGGAFKWCVVFQWWCFQKAGISTEIFPKSASVFAVRDWYKKRGRFYRKPMVGDLVIYSFSHIGLVEKLLTDTRIQTIEGNWNDRVVRRIHHADASDIEGYCRPKYHKVEPVQQSPSGGRTEVIVRALPRLERKDRGADVKRLQGLLVANGHKLPDSTKSDGTFDGEFGEETCPAPCVGRRLQLRPRSRRTVLMHPRGRGVDRDPPVARWRPLVTSHSGRARGRQSASASRGCRRCRWWRRRTCR